MIYDLVRRGELNPLSVDVIEVADKFLKEVERAEELDLRIPARVLLYASILIRMKSEIIANEISERRQEKEDFEEYTPEFLIEEIDFDVDFSIAKKSVRRFTTLEDLIRELKAAEEVQRRRKKRKRKGKSVCSDPLEVPHEEDFERVVEVVKEIIKKLGKRTVKLSEIEGVDLVSKYLSVLHLAYRGFISLKQEKIFESEIEIEYAEKN